MVVVAIVGGTGAVGKTLVDAFKADGKHEVIVLARKVPESGSAAPVIAVDYNDIPQLIKTLDDKKVHTVISTLVMFDPNAAQAELSVIEAADKSSSVKRFVASNYGNATPKDESLRAPFNAARDVSVAALRKTSLEWTAIHNGFFLDYFGMPHVSTYLTPLVWCIDIANRKAALPGTTGERKVTFTSTKDLGKFVVKAMELEKWEETLGCFSDCVSLKELLEIAEDVTGDKFTVTYDPEEKLRRGEITELPSHQQLYEFIPKPMLTGIFSVFGLWAIHGVMYVPKEGSLNEKFPEIRTTTAKEVISNWKGK
ncbi:NAD(P)-binding protein [Byssothecium circinans]|uniref:NAD(P)-binding protein n=1 Tax=Byssothecium circinans TaxID=147558 RepID=A0A6A5TUD5_9PLEO|nr:NAD(P)-binding protein [Byssothecium circinans]